MSLSNDSHSISMIRYRVAFWFGHATNLISYLPVLSPGKLEGIVGGCGLGGAYDNIKVRSVLKAGRTDMPYKYTGEKTVHCLLCIVIWAHSTWSKLSLTGLLVGVS